MATLILSLSSLNYAFNPSTLHVPQFSDCVMSKLEINTEQIYKHLSKLDIKKAQGCDDLGNHESAHMVLQSQHLNYLLTHLFSAVFLIF